MAKAAANQLDIGRTLRDSYTYMREAVAPTLLGTAVYALTGLATALILSLELLGSYSLAGAVCLYGFVALSWFAMALRRGTGQAEQGIFGMTFGLDEIRLGISTLAVAIALALVGFFIGFALFLVSMSSVIVDSGLAFQEDKEPLNTYLQNFALSDAGLMATVFIVAATAVAIGGFLYFVVRLLPFAAGSIARGKITALQSIVWTRYQGRSLLLSFLGSAGLAIAIVAAGQYALGLAPLPELAIDTLRHVLGCFGALMLVGFASSAYLQLASDTESGTQ